MSVQLQGCLMPLAYYTPLHPSQEGESHKAMLFQNSQFATLPQPLNQTFRTFAYPLTLKDVAGLT